MMLHSEEMGARMTYVRCDRAETFLHTLEDGSVSLLAIDPPYYGISVEEWDHVWSDVHEYAQWLSRLLIDFWPKLTPDGSVVFFGAIGFHGYRPLFETMRLLEAPRSKTEPSLYYARNMVTWAKRRAYGKEFDYLFCREEIAWYSVSRERDGVRFNKPYTQEKRGYDGWNTKYPAKSEYKRVSNVWADIPELMRPARSCEKPVPLMRRVVETHSHPGDLVVDLFAGLGATGVACIETGREFVGCDSDAEAVRKANERMNEVWLQRAADGTR